MNKWDYENACMHIASRCNQIFCKSFIMDVSMNDYLIIDAYPCSDFVNAPYSIHMVGDYSNMTFSVELRFEKIGREFEEGELSLYAYNMGHGISDNYMISLNRNGFIFLLNKDICYPIFEDKFTFSVDNEVRELISVNPLLHYVTSEFDMELFLYFSKGLIFNGAIKGLKKNGVSPIDLDSRGRFHDVGKLSVYKKDEGYEVILSGKSFFSNPICKMKVLSYMAQYALLGELPSIKSEKVRLPTLLAYFS